MLKARDGRWGLGLTLVDGLVKAHRGTIRVESFAEAATTFTVTLPRDAGPSERSADPPSGSPV